jgi:hypothetical protein
MSIDGATDIGEVNLAAWIELASDTGFSQRFAGQATASLLERVKAEATRLASEPEHSNDMAWRIVERIASLHL